eukprot:2899854-Prymnesium_polylepis.1
MCTWRGRRLTGTPAGAARTCCPRPRAPQASVNGNGKAVHDSGQRNNLPCSVPQLPHRTALRALVDKDRTAH